MCRKSLMLHPERHSPPDFLFYPEREHYSRIVTRQTKHVVKSIEFFNGPIHGGEYVTRGGTKRWYSFCFVSFFVSFCRFVLVLVVVLVAFFLLVAVVALPLLLLPTGKPPKPPPGPTQTYKTKRKTKRNKTKNTV